MVHEVTLPGVVELGSNVSTGGDESAAARAGATCPRSVSFDDVVPSCSSNSGGGRLPDANRAATPSWHGPGIFCLVLLSSAVVYSLWLVGGNFMTCDGDNTRTYFFGYVLFDNGVWFWLSLTSMACLFELILSRSTTSDWPVALQAFLRAVICAGLGLGCGTLGLYMWHVGGDRLDGGLETILVSKAIVMSCVGLFGVVLTGVLFIPASFKESPTRSFFRFMLTEGLCPVVLCCFWCALWLVAEIFSQCFGPLEEAIKGKLPPIVVALLQSLYIEIFSVLVLPLLRLMLGPVERHFLPRGDRGTGAERLTRTLRVITWIDLLFDGFRWVYHRVVFAKVMPETLTLLVAHHVAVSVYTYLWKYSPHRVASRIEFLISRCRTPPAWALRLAERPAWLRLMLFTTSFGSIFDFLSSALFSSTYFELSLVKSDPPISYTGLGSKVREGRRCVASLTILNHRMLVVVPAEEECPDFLRASLCLELTELRGLRAGPPAVAKTVDGSETPVEAFGSTSWLDKQQAKEAVAQSYDLAHVHSVSLALMQHVESRLSARQCMRLLSSALLLCTNVVLAIADTRTVRDPVGQFPDDLVRLLFFPLAMMASDIFEMCCMSYTYRGWLFSRAAVKRWRETLIGDPLFLLAQTCLMLHVAMSSVLGRHSVRLCI